jgi:SAM-dependent methyltransferase
MNADEKHAAQIEYWNGQAGQNWVIAQDYIDRMLLPVSDLLLARVPRLAGGIVYDVGCGCGATTLALGDRLGLATRIAGFDISHAMIHRALERSEGRSNISYALGDVSVTPFAPVADLLVSRFGVMFFGDPVAAFANMKTAVKPGGSLIFVCWRAFDLNPWMKVPLTAAYRHVPVLPSPEPGDPGPFSFADRDRVTRILTDAGWAVSAYEDMDVELDLAGGEGLDRAVVQASTIGAAAGAMRDQPEPMRQAAIAEIRGELARYLQGGRVPLGGAVSVVTCRAS